MENILFAPQAKNTDLLRSLALKDNKTFNTRIVLMKDLAELALERAGIVMEGIYICETEAAALIFNDIKAISYFSNSKFKNVVSLVKSINELRMHIISNEEETIKSFIPKGIFEEKNEAVLKVYDIYMSKLKANNRFDSIMLARKVIDEVKLTLPIKTLECFPLIKPLEKQLFKHLTNLETDNYKYLPDNKNTIKKYIRAYGESNEVEYVLNTIFKNNIKLDEVTVACANPEKYSKLFKDYGELYNFNVTSSIPDSVVYSNAGKLLKLIVDFENNYNDADSLEHMINAFCFNKDNLMKDLEIDNKYLLSDVIKATGALRLSFSDIDNNNQKFDNYKEVSPIEEYKEIPYVEKMKNIFNKGIISFLRHYTMVEKSFTECGRTALDEIVNYLSFTLVYDISLADLIETIPNLGYGAMVSKEGAIHVTTIPQAKSNFRKYLFVVGLSSDTFPGSPKEDYIVLDADYELFNVHKKSVLDNENIKNELLDLVKINESFNNDIYLIYSELSQADLKNHNASSVMFEIYNLENAGENVVDDFNDNIVELFGYDTSNLSKNSKIVKAYIDNKIDKNIKVENEQNEMNPITCDNVSDRGYSASAIVDYFKCDRIFYYKHFIKIPDEFTKDKFNVIQANDYGTLCHYILEKYSQQMDLATFLTISKEEYEKYLIRNVPIVLPENVMKKNLDDFIDIMTNAYNLKNNDEVVSKEEDHSVEYKNSGIRIHGLPDLIEKLPNNTYRIVDYKVKNTIDHDPSDSKSIIQILVYAYVYGRYMYDKGTPVKISEAEFQYLKQNKKIRITETKSMQEQKDEFNKNMEIFVNAIKDGRFIGSGTKDVCTYCKYKEICDSNKDN